MTDLEPTIVPGPNNTATQLERRKSDSSDSSTQSEASEDSCSVGSQIQSHLPNPQALLRICNLMAACYLVCSAVTFCSSAYTGPGSALDAVLVMFDVVCIDVSSALFVLTGCATAALYTRSTPTKQDSLTRHTAVAILVDLYIALCLSMIFGSAHALTLGRFHWRDLAFTALEGITTLRALDFRQSASAPHSYNVTGWPVQSLLWCVLSVKSLLALDALIVDRAPAIADALICLLALAGIMLFTGFGSLQPTSNIFYANASSVTYRSMEFNLGAHAVFLYVRHPPFVTAMHIACQKASVFVGMAVVTIWVAEVGRVLPPTSDGNCLRLYFRNACLQDHHGFFLRGCVLALFLLLYTDNNKPKHLQREIRISMTLVSAVCLCWPVYLAVKLVMDFTFGKTVIDTNRPVVVMMSISILAVTAGAYRVLIHPTLHARARHAVLSRPTAATQSPESLHTALV